MNKRLLILWALLVGLALAVPTVASAQVEVEISKEIVTISNNQYYMHHVVKGQTLYGISKVYGVSEEEIRKLNPEIDASGLQAGMVIGIPVQTEEQVTPPVTTPEVQPEEELLPISDDDEYGDGYVVHTVKESEKTKRLLDRWNVKEEDFRKLNPSVGSRVFVGQKVLIPVDPSQLKPEDQEEKGRHTDTIKIKVPVPVVEPQEEDTVVASERPQEGFALPEVRPDECYASPENAQQLYHVVLLVPLYLNNIDRLDLSKVRIEKTKHDRALKFLQFYEGFMMAVDSLTRYYGLRLELTVMDVTENVAGAESAVNAMQDEQVDLIIGPFFSKSFALVQEFALSRNIMIVNPMSERESIVVNAPNVVKVKPSARAMADELSDLIQSRYPKAKVTLIATGSAKDSAMVSMVENTLRETVEPEVTLSNAEMLDLIARESARRKMGKRVLSTLEVEGRIFSTNALREHPDGEAYFENQFQRFSYGETDVFKRGLSSARDNVLVAYGNDVVFATKILNTINKSTKKYPITLIGLPQWAEFESLLVPNLLNMNAIYFDDHFVDYDSEAAQDFIDLFRSTYQCDPLDYAFEGYDVAWYFLNALMKFGPHALDCLPYYHLPLLHARYYFTKRRLEDGLENRYWSVFQYDNQLIELKRVEVYDEEE